MMWQTGRFRGCVRAWTVCLLTLACVGCGKRLTCLDDQIQGPPPGIAFLTGDTRGIIPAPEALDALREFVTQKRYRGWCHDRFRDLDIRQTGPIVPVSGRSDDKSVGLTTHARVRVYYSAEVARWLDADRRGALPDGAMIVKEMYGIPLRYEARQPRVEGWAVMVRDNPTTADGWLWYLYYPWRNQPYTAEFESGQHGLSFCVACHASAERQGTFAFRGNLINDDVATYVELGDVGAPQSVSDADAHADADAYVDAGAHGSFARVPAAGDPQEIVDFEFLLYVPVGQPRSSPDAHLEALYREVVPEDVPVSKPRPLPMDAAFDHVPAAGDEPRLFLTADNCAGCHDASDLLNSTFPEMVAPIDSRHYPVNWLARDPGFVNLSPYGEWSGSLMSASVRDPVFRAQLEWEAHAYPDRAAETTTFCLGCHGPMGKRGHPETATDLQATNAIPAAYGRAEVSAVEAEFGALARDGVSCTVCHHIAADGLGEPRTFNATFETGPANELYGPYDDVRTRPMTNGIGITPRGAGHIANPGLCGSCHMVAPPVADDPQPDRRAHEQTTYLEWRNSDFARSGDPELTCQGCHMPRTDPMDPERPPVRSHIANIEDSSFPYVPHRLSSDDLDTPLREGYRRHTLTGINLFTLRFFAQFPRLLGANTFYPVRPSSLLLSPQSLVMSEATALAREATARLILKREAADVVVSVENLAGHKFPTGVGFRRAWLELSVRERDGAPIWCSGCSDAGGTLLDGPGGTPLPSERPAKSNAYEPDRSVIDTPGQVQIYETRHVNRLGNLTTSFLELDEEVKDNRLLPRGWDANAFPEYQMNPVPMPSVPLSHVDTVRYRLGELADGARVCSRLYYQALPPYYLLDRAALLADGGAAAFPESNRLAYMALRVDQGQATPDNAVASITGWKLLIASAGDCN